MNSSSICITFNEFLCRGKIIKSLHLVFEHLLNLCGRCSSRIVCLVVVSTGAANEILVGRRCLIYSLLTYVWDTLCQHTWMLDASRCFTKRRLNTVSLDRDFCSTLVINNFLVSVFVPNAEQVSLRFLRSLSLKFADDRWTLSTLIKIVAFVLKCIFWTF